MSGYLDIVKYLVLEHKLDPSLKDSSGLSPGNLAALKGEKAIVDFLKDHCPAEPSELENLTDSLMEGGAWLKSALKSDPMTLALRRHAVSGDLEKLKETLSTMKSRTEAVTSTGPNGETVLHNAAFAGNLNIVEYLVHECNSDINFKDSDGHTALHNSAHNGHTDVVRFLASQPGCEVTSRDKHKRTALHYASQNGHIDAVKCLVIDHGSDIIDEDAKAVTPFQLAAEAGNLDIVKFMSGLNQSTDAAGHTDRNGRTCLHGASQNNHLDVVKFLVEVLKCNPEQPDTAHGVNSIHLAASNGALEIIKFYDSLGYNMNTAAKHNQRIPLHQCSQNGHIEIVKHLIENHRSDCMARDTNGVTPFHLAAYNGHIDILKIFLTQPGVEPGRKDWAGRTA